MRFDSRRRARRGVVLVTYAMMFFALLGLAALVIDLGYARFAQRQMQAAADTTALEAARGGQGDGLNELVGLTLDPGGRGYGDYRADDNLLTADRGSWSERVEFTPPVPGAEESRSVLGRNVPLLFGRGRGVLPGDVIPIRAEAIAQAVPAKTAGTVQFVPDVQVEGLTPFALSRAFWARMGTDPVELTTGTTAWQAIDATRTLCVGLPLSARITPSVTFAAGAPPELGCFVPIYETIPDRGEWFVGFGVVGVTGTSPLTIQRRAGGTAFPTTSPFRAGLPFRNVSGSVLQSADRPDLAQVNAIPADAPVDAVFTLNRNLATDPATELLVVRAPVLVR